MKRILLLLIIILCITGCSNNLYDEISYKEFNSMIKNKDDFIIFIGSSTCGHCTLFKDTVNDIVNNYKLDIKYIDVSNFSEDELSEFKKKINFSGTPTTAFIKDGKEYCGTDGNCSYYRIVGNQDYDKVVKKLKQKGYIEG